MRDEECVAFLQWALPQLQLRWPGFRKVRAQVCKRLQRRLTQLSINEIAAYRHYLVRHHDEWPILDALCRVTISRFYRDKQMYVFLESVVLPKLAQRVSARGDDCLKAWCVGAASGEEPYTLAIIWKLLLQERFPDLHLQIEATDADPAMIQRCETASYDYSSVKNLPRHWRDEVFMVRNAHYYLKPEYQVDVRFKLDDIRAANTRLETLTLFDLVFCRNLVFTYFDAPLQQQTLTRLLRVLRKGGALVIGIHEKLPAQVVGLSPWSERLRIFEKT